MHLTPGKGKKKKGKRKGQREYSNQGKNEHSCSRRKQKGDDGKLSSTNTRCLCQNKLDLGFFM